MYRGLIKVICINCGEDARLEINKIYLTDVYTDSYIGINLYDLNKKFIGYHYKSKFMLLEEFREQRLNKIFND